MINQLLIKQNTEKNSYSNVLFDMVLIYMENKEKTEDDDVSKNWQAILQDCDSTQLIVWFIYVFIL